MSAEDKLSKWGRVDLHHRSRRAGESWCLERSPSVNLQKTFLLVVRVSEKGWGATWEVYVTAWWSDVFVVGLDGCGGGGKRF